MEANANTYEDCPWTPMTREEMDAVRPNPNGCCSDPQIRGGKCENCDQWFEDFLAEQDQDESDARCDAASALFANP